MKRLEEGEERVSATSTFCCYWGGPCCGTLRGQPATLPTGLVLSSLLSSISDYVIDDKVAVLQKRDHEGFGFVLRGAKGNGVMLWGRSACWSVFCALPLCCPFWPCSLLLSLSRFGVPAQGSKSLPSVSPPCRGEPGRIGTFLVGARDECWAPGWLVFHLPSTQPGSHPDLSPTHTAEEPSCLPLQQRPPSRSSHPHRPSLHSSTLSLWMWKGWPGGPGFGLETSLLR